MFKHNVLLGSSKKDNRGSNSWVDTQTVDHRQMRIDPRDIHLEISAGNNPETIRLLDFKEPMKQMSNGIKGDSRGKYI